MNATVASRLKATIEAQGRSLRDVSIGAGMSPDAVRGVLRHPDASPTVSTIKNLARTLGVSPEWLAFGIGDGPDVLAKAAPIHIPLISWVSAGAFGHADGIMATDDFPMIEVAGLPPGDWFALNVDGDSMDRISPPGSIILVNRRDQSLIPNACYVIANEAGDATYKRYRPSPDRFEPVSINPAHEPIFPNGQIRVIGRVRRSTIEM